MNEEASTTGQLFPWNIIMPKKVLVSYVIEYNKRKTNLTYQQKQNSVDCNIHHTENNSQRILTENLCTVLHAS